MRSWTCFAAVVMVAISPESLPVSLAVEVGQRWAGRVSGREDYGQGRRGLRQSADVGLSVPESPGLPLVLREQTPIPTLSPLTATRSFLSDPIVEEPDTHVDNEAAAELSFQNEEWLEGLADYLFFERVFSPDEQRITWNSWTENDKELYNAYHIFWLSASIEIQNSLIRLMPFVDTSVSEFMIGLKVYLDALGSDNNFLLQGLDNSVRYAYFKLDQYWNVLADQEKNQLEQSVKRSSPDARLKEQTSYKASSFAGVSLLNDGNNFKQGIEEYLAFLILPKAEQMATWGKYSLKQREQFYAFQSYWTGLSLEQQQQVVSILTNDLPGQNLPSRTAQQEFLLSLSQYLGFVSRPSTVQADLWLSFSDEIRGRFENLKQYWDALSSSEKEEHIALIQSMQGPQDRRQVVNPAQSEAFLAQLNRYLQFEAKSAFQQDLVWASLTVDEREEFARLKDYWEGMSPQQQEDTMKRIKDLLRNTPLAIVDGLTWEQIAFLTGLQEYLEHTSLPQLEERAAAKEWTMSEWDEFIRYDAYWSNLSHNKQQQLVGQLNRAFQAVLPGHLDEAEYKGNVTVERRQFLKGIVTYLEIQNIVLSDKLTSPSSFSPIERLAIEKYKEYWISMNGKQKRELLAELSEPGILNGIEADLSSFNYSMHHQQMSSLPRSMPISVAEDMPKEQLQFPLDIDPPASGKAVSSLAAESLKDSQINFLIGLKSYLTFRRSAESTFASSKPPPSVWAWITFYSRYWANVSEEEKTFLQKLIADHL